MASKKIEQKRREIEEDILRRATPLIESGEYTNLTVKEVCAQIGITTGMFYRHFVAKNDLLSFYVIGKFRDYLESIDIKPSDKSVEEQLLDLTMGSMSSGASMGTEGFLMWLDNNNPACSCAVFRNLFIQGVCSILSNALGDRYDEKKAHWVAEYLLIVQKGISYEWYTMRNEPSFHMEDVLNRALHQAIYSLDYGMEK